MPLSASSRIITGPVSLSDVRCESNDICCSDDLPQPCGSRVFPAYLVVTLSGWAAPDICNYDFTDLTPSYIGLMTDANNWQNGSYRLKRVPYSNPGTGDVYTDVALYILEDSVKYMEPGITSETTTPPGTTTYSSSQDVESDNGFYPIIINTLATTTFTMPFSQGCVGDLDALVTADQLYLAPGVCEYAPDCDYDIIASCGVGTDGPFVSFSQTGVADMISSPGVTTGTDYAVQQDASGSPTVLQQSQYGISIKTFKQLAIELSCSGAFNIYFTTCVVTWKSYVQTNTGNMIFPTIVRTGTRVPYVSAYSNPLIGPVVGADSTTWSGSSFAFSYSGVSGQVDIDS